MIKANQSLDEAKKSIQGFWGKSVKVTVNLGRNKAVSYTGKLSGVYPALFTVSPNEKGFLGKTSYSYSEYMCKTVLIKEIK